jgi:hypothetical protein
MLQKQTKVVIKNLAWSAGLLVLALSLFLNQFGLTGSWILPLKIVSTLLIIIFFISAVVIAIRQETGRALFLSILFAVILYLVIGLTLWDQIWAGIIGIAMVIINIAIKLPTIGASLLSASRHFGKSVCEISKSLPE